MMINFTEFGANSDHNFPLSVESVLMAGQRLRCWPTIKNTILEYSPIFQVSDILLTVYIVYIVYHDHGFYFLIRGEGVY